MELSVSAPRYPYYYPSPNSTTTATYPVKPSSSISNQLRRPKTITSPTPPPPPGPTKPIPKTPSNPFKNLINPTQVPSSSLTSKLWLTSKLSPPPPPPPPFSDEKDADYNEPKTKKNKPPRQQFRQQGKIFVGNIPNYIKKHELSEFFRQFGPITDTILIKGHHSTETNAGFGFIIYGGGAHNAAKSAMKAVEFDGFEFHGRVLSVRLDDGSRLKERAVERSRWIEDGEEVRARSKWHKERQSSRNKLREVMETAPENWQAVVNTFDRIDKPSRGEYGLMVKYYARRGDMHRARETFERMRARGIEPTSHVYTRYYARMR